MALMAMLFALVFVTELISWVGKTVLLEFFYALYLRIFYSAAVTQQRKLKSDILLNKKELLQTSAQDQFAKWAKLRRSVDKGLADLEKLNGDLSSARTAFSMRFNTALWVMTTGAQFVIGWWYRKAAVFYLPPGWFGPLTWWLALPFAPAGSVSCGVWQMACRRVIKLGERAVRDVVARHGSSTTPVPSEGAKTEGSGKKVD
ncbi:CHD5-like protein-domain-containing protein [Epithele typhae]|uniref:CHD5-like protein-domain-containing protein n=1 Tax=Epithele typhae TaxID=378194 RepID=UPI002008C26E|nr:CHD5-like protein-domain-containing protein [Epithele typhae]KAH9942425.1 CHD5-like protein-domain-containing protein [Epithele typhae]